MQKSSFKSVVLIVFLIGTISSIGAKQNSPEPRLEPPSWWIGFEEPEVQLMAYGEDIGLTRPEIDHPGVSIRQITGVENDNYLFIDLLIGEDAQPGKMEIRFKDDGEVKKSMTFELNEREKGSATREGFNTSDAIYLLMPDRFANGNTKNDDIEGMREMSDRSEPYGRHGGDIQGIIDHLDYIDEMGFTAIWLNPVLENDQPESSYHGYATTDYYKVDPRYGSNEDYKELVSKANEKGIKIVKDMIFNHCGNKHWWMNDLPSEDWINYDKFVRSNYRLSTIPDPYVSRADLKLATEGWFDKTMPDLNLRNELLRTYLIQNSIWWIEYAGLQGIRQDTYPYPDKHAMAEWNKRINKEYPNFNIVGETWIGDAAKLCYYQKDFPNKDGFNTHLKTITDFPLMDAIHAAFNEEGGGWSDGLMRLYNSLANDHLYPSPKNMLIFPENHDAGRIYTILEEDIDKLKMVTAFTATVRGIPQWYYGSEILMTGKGHESHADIRNDFPGGWPGDETNAFVPEGRTSKQNEMVNYLTKLLNFRKDSKAIQEGKTLHFVPEDHVYVYFRHLEDEAVMVMLNNAEEESRTIGADRYREILSRYNTGKDVISDKTLTSLDEFEIPAKSAKIIELKK